MKVFYKKDLEFNIEKNIVEVGTISKLFEMVNFLQSRNKLDCIEIQARPSKKLLNCMLWFDSQRIETVYHWQGKLLKNEQAISVLTYTLCGQAITANLAEITYKTKKLIIENNIPLDVINNIDNYAERFHSCHIEVGQSLVLVEKKSTYKPTDLERKQWGVSDKTYAFSNNGKCKYIYQTTLYDLLVAYLEYKYITNNKVQFEENWQTLTELTQLAILETLKNCGRDYTIPLSACEPIDNFDNTRYENICYWKSRQAPVILGFVFTS